MEFKTDALLLRAADYGENDKIVTLLTADRGKLAASLKGVKKAGAKLRFAAQPFCFAEYVLTGREGRHTVISAALYDGFYSLREDVKTFYAGAAVLEICDRLVLESMESGGFLLAAVQALKALSLQKPGEEREGEILITFLLKVLKLAGYVVRTSSCSVCGHNVYGRGTGDGTPRFLHFDFETGSFVCPDCAVGVKVSDSTYRTLSCLSGGEGEITEDGVKRALRLLRAYFIEKTDSDIPTLGEYLALL